MGRENGWKLGVVCALSVAAMTSPAQTFTTLSSFNGTNGGNPYHMSLVQGLDGNFYGTTLLGGSSNKGTIFMITPGGALTTLYSFTGGSDGALPYAGLVQATDGNLYGTTNEGGITNNGCPRSGGCGTVFKINPTGSFTTIYRFCTQPSCTDGALPEAGLIQANGNFYGTTGSGGTSFSGTVFEIGSGGSLITFYNFCSQPSCADGTEPGAGLIQATDGNFYGTTLFGGASNNGTVFKITPARVLTVLYSFGLTDGAQPYDGLVQGADGNFYGTTYTGGANSAGTVFKITLRGALTTLYRFCSQPSCADGGLPYAGLIQASDGNFYGTTSGGGSASCTGGCGTVFKITPAGALTTVHTFDSTDGSEPHGGLLQATNGTLYGSTYAGVAFPGTVFGLSVGLGPLVEALPTSGKVGLPVTVLGTDLIGTTSVSFHGRAAKFTVASASEISTTVPNLATTGRIQVTTPGGTLVSNPVFRVTPVISSFSPTSGPAGTVVTITGRSLTGAASVTFGGVKAASFTVNSYTQITATVAAGATGRIVVITPGGKAVSSGIFTVN